MSTLFYKLLEIYFSKCYTNSNIIELEKIIMDNRLKELRTKAGLLQKDVANLLDVAVSTYSYWEKGTYDIDLDNLNRLAKYYGVTIDYILCHDEMPTLKIPEEYKDLQVAFYDGIKDLKQEDIDELVKFMEYLKSKKK